MASPASRALRVGVLLGDNLVEERILPIAAPITFGQSLRCTLSIPIEGVPFEHVLFSCDQGRMLLHLTPHMTGRLGQAEAIEVVDPARRAIPIPRGVRGKLRLGEVTLLFQEIAAQPIAPKPRLPAAIRGSFGDRIDRRLALIVGGSLLAHLGIAAWAWATDLDNGAVLNSPTVAQTFYQETMDITMPDDPPVVVPAPSPDPGQPGVAAPVTPRQVPSAITHPPVTLTLPDPAKAIADAERMAAILTGPETAEHGPGEMHRRQPGADLDKQIEDIQQNHRHVSIGTDRQLRPEQKSRLGTDTGPVLEEPKPTDGAPPKHDLDRGRITITPLKHPPGTTLTVETVLGKIQHLYMTGLQRCYQHGLLADASLGGKVVISFTVDEAGHTIDAEAKGPASGVDSCIQGEMRRWLFPVPKSARTGEPIEVPFEVSLALQAPN